MSSRTWAVLSIVLIVLWVLLFGSRTAEAQVDFAGFGFGVGFAVSNVPTDDIVDPADVSVQDGILEVSKFGNVFAGMVFESHVTFQVWDSVAMGPYFSITPGTDHLIDAVAMGVLWELNRPRRNAAGVLVPSPVSFNIGLGANMLLRANVLRDGFLDGQPPPTLSPPTVGREKFAVQLITVLGF